MVVPYIVAVLIGVLAHVHLLCLDGRIAVGGRVICGICGGTAVKIILLVLHGCVYMRFRCCEWWYLVMEQVKVGSRLRLASGGNAPRQSSLQSSFARVLLHAGFATS